MDDDRSTGGLKFWSDHIAGLAADALIDATLVEPGDFERAAAIISEEVYARLSLGDHPPSTDS